MSEVSGSTVTVRRSLQSGRPAESKMSTIRVASRNKRPEADEPVTVAVGVVAQPARIKTVPRKRMLRDFIVL